MQPPPLQDRSSTRRTTGAAAAAATQLAQTPDSVVETDNSRVERGGGVRDVDSRCGLGGGGGGGGFAPLAASASMPAVMLAGHQHNRAFTPSHSVPQTPSDVDPAGSSGVGATAVTSPASSAGGGGTGGGGSGNGSGTAGLGAGGGVRGRTNLRRFHSMNAHGSNHSPGNSRMSGGRMGIRERDRDRERDREQKERDRDTSYTQCAMADDDNVSALQQMTRAGGGRSLLIPHPFLCVCACVFGIPSERRHFVLVGMTLASQWKSQFDDSEETDDELQGEHLQSPEHHAHLPAQLASLGFAMQMHFGGGGGGGSGGFGGSAPSSPILVVAPGKYEASNTGDDEPAEGGLGSADGAQLVSGQTALCVATLPRRSKRPPERLASKDGGQGGSSPTKEPESPQLVKGSTLDGLDVEGADTVQVPPSRQAFFSSRSFSSLPHESIN